MNKKPLMDTMKEGTSKDIVRFFFCWPFTMVSAAYP